jgi:hypothetical protein
MLRADKDHIHRFLRDEYGPFISAMTRRMTACFAARK